jgi:hypothetical protein
MPGAVLALWGWRGSGGLHEPGPPVQRWRLYRAYVVSDDGGGGTSRLQQWSRLALEGGRIG